MNARDGMRRLRSERIERGVCVSCGIAKAEHGQRRCRECINYQNKYMRDYYQNKKKKGTDSNG